MTGDDLRAAVERFRLRRAGEDVTSDNDWHEPTSSTRDAYRLADAYLADHPADDAHRWTPLWLVAAGFVPDAFRPGWLVLSGQIKRDASDVDIDLSLSVSVDNGRWELAQDDGVIMNTVALPDQTTRGHVRRLAAAVGLALTRGGQPCSE